MGDVGESGLYAVLTGDVVGAAVYQHKTSPKRFLRLLHRCIEFASKTFEGDFRCGFTIFRGDNFQGVLRDPTVALRVCLLFRALLQDRSAGERGARLDARIAVGIGTVAHFARRAGESTGEAFARSVEGLEEMRRPRDPRRLLIRGADVHLNREWDIACALLDALVSRWTSNMAEAMCLRLSLPNKTLADLGPLLNISAQALSQRLGDAGFWAIERFEGRMGAVIRSGGPSTQ